MTDTLVLGAAPLTIEDVARVARGNAEIRIAGGARSRIANGRARLEELDLEIVAPERRTPEYLAKHLPAEIERWAKPIRAAGISAD